MATMSIQTLVKQIKRHSDCRVYAPSGLPTIATHDQLPEDVIEFYEAAGGLELFTSQEYPYRILGPKQTLPANPTIVPSDWEEPEWRTDITDHWYLIAADPENQYLTIDFSLERPGRCYDSFMGKHGIPGYCPIIALSFTELLTRLWKAHGAYPYWLDPDFASLGDAYD